MNSTVSRKPLEGCLWFDSRSYHQHECKKSDLRYRVSLFVSRSSLPDKVIEANEPAFLRRLKNEHGGGDASRHERPQARAKKQMKDEDQDDQPVYVVEETNESLSKADYEKLAKERDGDEPESSPVAQNGEAGKRTQPSVQECEAPTDKVAAIGSSNRKRSAKRIGDDEHETENFKAVEASKHGKASKGNKGKKIKLSFDVEEQRD